MTADRCRWCDCHANRVGWFCAAHTARVQSATTCLDAEEASEQ